MTAAIGVDVGGTKTALALIDAASDTPLAMRVIPTGRERGGAAVLRDIQEHVVALAGLGHEVTGIGVVVPENVNLAGQITSSAVIPQWNELPVASVLSAVAPTVIDSDVRAAALAEAVLGAGRDYGYHLFLTVSTGISYCAVRDGRPFAGAHGGALHFGTSVLAVLPDGQELRLEDVASGGALVRRYVAGGGARGGAVQRAEEVLAAAAAGDPVAAGVLASGAQALGAGIALLINMLDPEAVILGGGLGSADTSYGAAARSWASHYVHAHAEGTPIVRGRLGGDAGVIGAGLIGLSATANSHRDQEEVTRSVS
jgi:glucokinase